MKKDLQYYKKLLPKKITVKIHKSKQGFWAEIRELPYCYTQAKDIPELIIMINDAIFTHLNVPKKFKSKIGYYIPIKLLEELKRKKWEQIFAEIVNKGRIKEKVEIFTRS